MADDAQSIPPVRRAAAQNPAVGRDDWLVAEGRRLALLREAITTVFRIAGEKVPEDKHPWPLPRPLPLDVANRLEDTLRNHRDDHNAPALGEREVEQAITKAIDDTWERLREPAGIVSSAEPPVGSRKQCLEAWIAAGEAIRQAREVIRRSAENEAKAQAAAERKRPLMQRLKPWGGTQPRAADAGTLPSWRLARLLDTLARYKELRTPHMHPAFWCADHEGPHRLTVDSFHAAVRENESLWNQPAGSQRECLDLLVRVAGRYTPVKTEPGVSSESCPHDIFSQWRHALVTHAVGLTGSECKPGESLPTAGTVKNWQFLVSDGEEVVVLASPLIARPKSPKDSPWRVVAQGVISVPQVATIRNRLHQWAHARPPDAPPVDAGLVDTIDLTINDIANLHVLVPDTDASSVPRTAPAVVEALHACARLLMAIEVCCPPAGSSAGDLPPPEHFRLAAMRAGVFVAPGDARVYDRIVPWHDANDGQSPRKAPPALQLHVSRATVQVGTRSARTACDPVMLRAIEDRDWRLWAIRQASRLTDDWLPRESRESLDALLKHVASRQAWEAHKRRLFSSDRDPESVVDCVRSLLSERRALTRAARDAGDTLTQMVVQDTRRCLQAMLTHLHAIDPDRLGRFDPPRLPCGQVDLFRWIARPRDEAGDSLRWNVAWRSDPAPFGTQIAETSQDSKMVMATFSASSLAGLADIELLHTALETVWTKAADDPRFAPLRRLGVAILQPPAAGTVMPDFAGALASLRDAFAGPDRESFDALIGAATAAQPDPLAIRWVTLLRDDVRFGFTCHPPIEWIDDRRTFRVKPVSSVDEPWLEWQDAADVPPDTDVHVVHAIEPGHARRVLSRGRPREDSTERLAVTLEQSVSRELSAFGRHAGAIRRGIDLVRTVPDERSRWSQGIIDSIGALLDQLVDTAAGREASGATVVGDDAIQSVFEAVVRIGAACGHVVTPASWNPRTGTPPDGVPGSEPLAVAFHATVPSGAVIVDRFGIEGETGRECVCRRSAGRAPDGFNRLKTLIDGLTGGAARIQELRQGIEDLPKHVLGEKSRLAIPSLYASVWHVLIEHPADAGDPAPWREAIAELIRRPYDMVMFEPAKLGDYPTGWILGPDGKPPRGRRVARVVRPGVRTLEKKLVWPAIVETE